MDNEPIVNFDEPPTTQDDIRALINELRSLAFSDIGELYDDNNCLRGIKTIPAALRRAIAGIEVEEIYTGTGSFRECIGHTKKVKLWDKKGAIDSFMKHLGMFIERLEVKQTVTVKVQRVDLDERRLDIKNRIQAVN